MACRRSAALRHLPSTVGSQARAAIRPDNRAPPAPQSASGSISIADDSTEEPFLRGEKTLEELRAAGINTEVVRRAKVTAKGDREIELHDRAGAEVDRIIGHTAPSIGELAKQARLDAGQATERIDGVVMRVIGPRREHNQE